MARNYYTLVAGLRQYAFDSDNKGFDAVQIVDEIRGQLGKKDRGYLTLFYNFYDISNIINIKAGRKQFSELGNYDREMLEQEIENPSKLPEFIARVLLAYDDPQNPEYDEADQSKSLEKALFTAYYNKCGKSGNDYIREWYEFDRNLRNLLAAHAARKASLPIADELVGSGYVVDNLSRSSAADFGLKGELDYIDSVLDAVTTEENLLEKERKLDMVRWGVSDELTEFDYFNMDAILGYLSKVNLIHRWASLDPEYGREMFRKLIESFTGKAALERSEEQ